MVLSETSLLWFASVSIPVVRSLEMYLLDDDENLDSILRFAFQQVVKPVSLITRPTQVELRRDPPVVDINTIFGHVYRSTEVPEVISLHPSVFVSYWVKILKDEDVYTVDKPLRRDVHSQRRKGIEPVTLGPDTLRRNSFH